MNARRSPNKALVFLSAGPQKIDVVEHPYLRPGQVELIDGRLFVGPGTHVDEAVFRLNCTAADVRFLQSLHIEAP